MYIDFILNQFKENENLDGLIWRNKRYSYKSMLENYDSWKRRIINEGIPRGSVVALDADFSPTSVALLLALIESNCIIALLSKAVRDMKDEFCEIAEAEYVISLNKNDEVSFIQSGKIAQHELLTSLRELNHPGVILFSSGSTGKSKAAVHDFVPLLNKFKVKRHAKRTMAFLLFDHIGGLNTMFYTFSNGGCLVTVDERSPENVCLAIEDYHVQILPTSPTFINLLILSEAYKNRNLESLELVTYGTEVMPETTLKKFHTLFPKVRLLQTYGLSEVGILRSKSKSSDSLWVKVGGEEYQTRVIDGMLEIKAKSAMLGYLNAPSPLTEDGWFMTNDAVLVDGEYMKILGRKSEIINVGGEKVYPAEVESVVQLMEGVEEVAVSSETNPITGQMIKASVKLSTNESLSEFRKRLYLFCRDKLPSYKIPQKLVIVTNWLHNDRFKKMRKG
ncbi:fatty acid--CoA ligase family protein [Bacillus sp. 31A1R]|uniref:Fatty acid--CoA ligase family protein n=1 Tax=Robertmurraya mangrovi TaxID=3098077 RepID=A0ABU5J1S4_9BACI|nr:fatty acid--CoA ligase family protein [Bacillus sp. 31A1R]MDZ5473306.1 fatty acid--CoA ligase family protein [Bacillus sp. 31A1R]